jgi:hypothetical protein
MEAGHGLRVAGDVFRQKLQRDESVQTSVLGLLDHSHAPAPEPFEDAVVGDRLPYEL